MLLALLTLSIIVTLALHVEGCFRPRPPPRPPVNCEWGTWGSWESCSATCGGGTEERIRVVDKPPQNGGRPCTGGSTDVQSCSTQSCVPAAWETTIDSAVAGSQITYVVTCEGPCTQLTASILTTSGDADLYASEDQPPSLNGFECWECSMCEAYTGDSDDICPNMETQNGNSFHLMVSAYITYTNGLLQLFGSNINSVELAPTPTPGPTTTPGGGGGGGNATGCVCGLNELSRNGWSPKVVGGQDAGRGEIGWQVGLSYSSSASFASIFCGGTLINEKWVLTAAHCTESTSNPSSFWLWIGLIERNIPSDAVIIQADRKIEHPNYGSLDYDFALLRLSQAVDFTNSALSHVFPACWPSSEPNIEGQRAVISGWGTISSGGSQPNKLQKADVEIISRATCNSASSYSGSVTAQMICAGFLAGGIDTCQGDSGGPLVTLNGNNWEVTGVTSWGSGCASPNYPGVYANAFAARQWIASTTESTECPRSNTPTGTPGPPVNCTWASWGTWGSCSSTCGEGTQQRSRNVDQPAQNGGYACSGTSVEERSCNFQSCPAAAWNTTIPSAETGSQITYVVTCDGPCSLLTATITTSSGDADLYANEDQPPILTSYNCPDCSMCQAITTDLSETCPNMSTQNGDSFYLLVNAWSTYTSGLLEIFGTNINNVEMAPSPTPGPATTPGGGGGGSGGGGGNATGCFCGLNALSRKGWSPKVVGGEDAGRGEIGWQVGLSFSSSTSYASTFCGGTLINEKWVLTAAHCTELSSNPSSFWIWIGLLERNNPSDGIVVQADRKFEHPNYGSLDYDFALLRLSQAVDFTNSDLSHVFPACWASSEPTIAGQRAVISGWGTLSSGGSSPSRLQKANVEIIPRSTCNSASSYSGSVTAQMVCAGFLAGQIDTCQGDSGGPLVTLNGNHWEVTGVTSWGRGCAGANYPGVYANAFAARDWIASTTASTECPRN